MGLSRAGQGRARAERRAASARHCVAGQQRARVASARHCVRSGSVRTVRISRQSASAHAAAPSPLMRPQRPHPARPLAPRPHPARAAALPRLPRVRTPPLCPCSALPCVRSHLYIHICIVVVHIYKCTCVGVCTFVHACVRVYMPACPRACVWQLARMRQPLLGITAVFLSCFPSVMLCGLGHCTHPRGTASRACLCACLLPSW